MGLNGTGGGRWGLMSLCDPEGPALTVFTSGEDRQQAIAMGARAASPPHVLSAMTSLVVDDLLGHRGWRAPGRAGVCMVFRRPRSNDVTGIVWGLTCSCE